MMTRFLRVATVVILAGGILGTLTPTEAVTLYCRPPQYYVPLAYIPISLRGANIGCQYRQTIANTTTAMYAWRATGTTRCLNIWKTSPEWLNMTRQQKLVAMPAWCAYYAGNFVYYGN